MPSKFVESIELTPVEMEFYSRIPQKAFAADEDTWSPVADAMQALMESLESRDAVPEIRRTVFFDLREKNSKSEFEKFESAGKTGVDMVRHGHFVEHLQYFINGPDLPVEVVNGFLDIVNDDLGTSGMLLKNLQKFVRKSVREYNLPAHKAATNFWRLCHEVEYLHADAIRKAALDAK